MNTKNEYIFRTPSDWGTVTGVFVAMPNGKAGFIKIEPEPNDLEFATENK